MAMITSLNDDILLKIFEDAVHLSDSIPNKRNAPLNLSHTCQHWRDIILANKRFWTRFKAKGDRDMRFAYLWLERSRDAILDLDFRRGNISGGLLGLVFENQPRLRRLLVQGTKSKFPIPVVIRDLSNMVEMTLPFTIDTSLPSDPPSRPIAPKMTNLTVGLESYGVVTIGSTFDLIEQCPNLVELSLDFWDDGMRDGLAFRPLCFQALQTLTLHIHFRDNVEGWLQHLTAPSLRSLRIRDYSVNPRLRAILADFLERSQPGGPVERFSLASFDSTIDEHWVRLIQALPNLREYECDSFPLDVSDHERLTIGSTSGNAWPLLQKFRKNFRLGDIDAMVGFVLSRLNRPHPFSAEIHVQHVADEVRNSLDTHEELSQWKDDSESLEYLVWSNIAWRHLQRANMHL